VTVQIATAIAFHQSDSQHAWRMDVIVDGVLCGHIDRSGDDYRYFEGVCNEVIWSFADRDLARLQSRIRSTVIGERASELSSRRVHSI